ncbi:hypothetical protein Mapa_011406 [Marchantia paleacea]|nr:hypothetical protein Mapa_011406 [Marchantia paleacea]
MQVGQDQADAHETLTTSIFIFLFDCAGPWASPDSTLDPVSMLGFILVRRHAMINRFLSICWEKRVE